MRRFEHTCHPELGNGVEATVEVMTTPHPPVGHLLPSRGEKGLDFEVSRDLPIETPLPTAASSPRGEGGQRPGEGHPRDACHPEDSDAKTTMPRRRAGLHECLPTHPSRWRRRTRELSCIP